MISPVRFGGRPAKSFSSLPRAPLCALVLTLLAGACRTAAPSATASAAAARPDAQAYLVEVERRAASESSAPSLGRAALATYLVTGQPDRAAPWITKALAADAHEPQALYTKVLIAREALDDRANVEASLAILQYAPTSPLAELAAFRLRELAGQSPALDALMLDGLKGLNTGSMGLEGHAALRAREALATILDAHNDDAGSAAIRSQLGMPTAWTVVGPLSAYRLRDFPNASPFDDPRHVLTATYPSVVGPVAPRDFVTPDGALDLESESWRADLFEAVADLSVKTGGEYLVALRGANAATLYLDGVIMARRVPVPNRPPERAWARVELPSGTHRLRVRFARVDSAGVGLSLVRADGAPADLTYAPVAVGAAAPVAAARSLPPQPWGMAAVLDQAKGAGDPSPVDRYLRIQQLLPDDSERARAGMEDLVAAAGESAVVRSLRADVTSSDPDLPRANAIGQISQDLEAILKVVPGDARALLGRFQQERNDKRYDEAAARMKLLVAAVGDLQPHILMERARFNLDRGDSAEARRMASAALKADPGRCESLSFRADLARRDGEIRLAEQLVPQLLACPGGVGSNITFLKSHLKLTEAVPLMRRLVARSPSAVAGRRALADALFALGDTAGAAEVLTPLTTLWPRQTEAIKKLAGYDDAKGDVAAGRALRERALKVDGGDLSIERELALDARKDVLDWAARDGLKVIDDFRKADYHPSVPAVQVLDLGVLELLPDGSSLERVQSVVQVLDKKGIDRFGEVSLPSDAQPLLLRTIKADGRILDAEQISGKETVSLPNLEPGDFVEYEYVRASGPRPAVTPGWSGGQFVFQGEDVPFFESTYIVRAPESLGLELDQEHLDPVAKIEHDGKMLTMTYTRHGSEPYLHEPMSVGDVEVLPWVEAGAGAGQDSTIAQLADWLPLRTRLTSRVLAFVRSSQSLAPAARVNALIEKIRDQVRGDSSTMDLSESAASILIRGRGNRMLALKAALAAAGIPSHIVLARPYNEYQHAFRFPHGGVYHVALLRIEPPGAPAIWMDFSLRLAPVNRIPAVLSGQDAYVVPNDAVEPVARITLPMVNPMDDRTDAEMTFQLADDGTLTGTLRQTAFGFDAASLRSRLEQVNATEFRKQQERSLSHTFQDVTLTDFAFEDSGDPAQPIVARSVIQVPRYTARAGGATRLSANFGPLYLGRRFVTRADRKTPLLIAVDDLSRTHVTVKLPPTTRLDPPEPVDYNTAFGRYQSNWKIQDGSLVMDETFLIHRARVGPDQYSGFKAFAAEVDAAQNREIPIASR